MASNDNTPPVPAHPSGRQRMIERYREWLRDRRRRGRRLLPFSVSGATARLLGLLLGTSAVLAAGFALALRYTSPVSEGTQISLGELRVDAARHQVTGAVLHDFDHRVTGTVIGAGERVAFWSTYPASDAETPALIDELGQSTANLSVDSQTTKLVVHFIATYVLPLVLLADLFALVFVLTQGRGGEGMAGLQEFSSIGRDRGRANRGGGVDRITFADVAGADAAVVELSEVKDYLTDPQRFAAVGARAPKGVMMFGPPGCGKTLMARAVAGEADVPFFSISGAEFVESLVGVGAARVRDLFRQVRRVAPAILFIDEIDAAGRRRGGAMGGQEEREQTLNQLLIEMDGFDPTAGVVVIGATNRPDILDPALLRPGRFDRQVTVEPPDLEGRIEILRLYAGRRPVEANVDFEYLARRTPGFTGADLSNVVNEAALLVVRQGRATIARGDFDEAVQRVLAGPRRRGHLLSEEERLRAAYHETAHLLVAAVTGRLGDIPRVTIVAHGRNLGATIGRAWAERTLITRSELFDEVVTVMAGTAAEEMVFGEASTGADADLERATQVATLMVGRYGMSDRIGKVHLLKIDGSEFLGGEMVPSDLTGPTLLDGIHEEVKTLLQQADDAAQRILGEHRSILDAIVDRLLDHESLEGRELAAALDPLRPPPRRVRMNGSTGAQRADAAGAAPSLAGPGAAG